MEEKNNKIIEVIVRSEEEFTRFEDSDGWNPSSSGTILENEIKSHIHTHTTAVLEAVIAEIEGMKKELPLQHDLKGNCDYQNNKTIDHITTLLKEVLEVISK